MNASKIIFVLAVLFLCSACNKGFEIQDIETSTAAARSDSDNRTPVAPTALDDAYNHKETASSSFDLKSITNSNWKLIGTYEQHIVIPTLPGSGTNPPPELTKTPLSGVSLSIGASQTLQKNCVGGPCPNDTMEQSTLEIRSTCQAASVVANFEKSTYFSDTSKVNGVSLTSDVKLTTTCEDSSNAILTSVFGSIAERATSVNPTSIAAWGNYLYIGIYDMKTFVFMKQ